MSDRRDLPRLALESDSSDVAGLADGYLREYLDKIRLSCARLGEEEIWWRATPHSNSIGNLLLHLSGNLSLWLRATLGGRDFVRDRAAEFGADRSAGPEELLDGLASAVEDCRSVVAGLDAAALASEHVVQGYRVSGLGVLFHAVEHMSYHTGQIVQMAKALRDTAGERLEFYPHLRKGDHQ